MRKFWQFRQIFVLWLNYSLGKHMNSRFIYLSNNFKFFGYFYFFQNVYLFSLNLQNFDILYYTENIIMGAITRNAKKRLFITKF